MTVQEIIEKLESPGWETLSIWELDSVNKWMILAQKIKRNEVEQFVELLGE